MKTELYDYEHDILLGKVIELSASNKLANRYFAKILWAMGTASGADFNEVMTYLDQWDLLLVNGDVTLKKRFRHLVKTTFDTHS